MIALSAKLPWEDLVRLHWADAARPCDHLTLKYQARCRAVGEHPPPVIRDPTFRRSDPTAAIQHDALCLESDLFPA